MNRVPILALLVFLSFTPVFLRAGDLPAGTAKGTFTPEEKPAVTLANAIAFVDQKEEGKPVLLILSDKKVPAEKWTSEFDLMLSHPTFSGAVFFIDKDGTVYRSDIYVEGKQSSVSGYFKLTLDGEYGKDLKGTVQTNDPAQAGPRLDATFHATVK
jgi:hypothetical protein